MSSAASAQGAWYALWTHSHCEQLVHDQLAGKGLRVFYPTIDVWAKRQRGRRLLQAPMFPGYLFIRDALEKETHLAVRKTRGVVRVLGERWDRLSTIPEEDIDRVRRVVDARQPVLPVPYLREGQRARIVSGPLAGVEGVLVESRARRGLLVLSVHLLQQSVAVVVDGTDVVPA
jgi:transcription antitermination factor NusG